MTTLIIDGTVEEAVTARSRRGTTLFKSIRFQLDDGTSRTLTKAVVKQPVADEIKPGASGRFYLFNAFDLKGIHGVRTPDGRELFAFSTANQTIFLVIAIINLLFIVFRAILDGQIPMLGLALLVLGAVGWFFMSRGAAEAKRQFDGDSGYAGSPAVTRPL